MKRHLISYPKSGRTWVRYALSVLEVADKIQFQHDGFEFNDGAKPPHDFDYDRRVEAYSQIDRVVYLSRDPRDLMVSLYFQVTGRFCDFFGYQGTVSEFIRDDYFGAENLQRFRRIWERMCSEGHAMHITYEECHRDLVAVLKRVTDFCGFEFTAERLHEAAEASSFENMKAVESSGRFPHPWLRPRNSAPKIRRGVVGGFRDHLSETDIKYLTDVFFRTDLLEK